MVRPERFELPTYSSGGCRSIQLSYGRAAFSLQPGLRPINAGGLHASKEYAHSRLRKARRTRLPATSATTAAPTAAVPTTISTATSAAFYLGAGLVHVQRPSAHLAAVKRSDCFLSFFRVRHFDKTETTGTASFAIGHDADAVHLPIRCEKLTQFVFTGIEIQISYKNVLHANFLGVSYLSAADFGGKRGGWLAVQIAGVGEQSNAWEV